MPVRIFWSMSSAVERLQAAAELSQFDAMCVAQADQKARNEFRESLRERLGTISRVEKPRSTPGDIMQIFVPLGD